MIEVLNSQTSGNDWSFFNGRSLRGEVQPTTGSVMSVEQHSIFKNYEQQMSEFNHEALIVEVRKHYVLSQDVFLSNFLSSHRTIPPLLLQATSRLKEFFGEDTVFTLRAPIDESGEQTLYVVANWRGSAKSARIALDRFDDVWWISNSRQASGSLVFTYELV